MSPPFKPSEQKRREPVKILAERHGITKVDEVYEDGEPPLMNAALGNHAEMVKILLNAAETACSGECTRLLQRAGGRAGRRDPFFQAVANGDTAAVKELVSTHKFSRAKLQRTASNACIADNAVMLKLLSPLMSNSKPGKGWFLGLSRPFGGMEGQPGVPGVPAGRLRPQPGRERKARGRPRPRMLV